MLVDWRLHVRKNLEAIDFIFNDHLGLTSYPQDGCMFAHIWSQKQSCDNFEGLFLFVQPQPGIIFASLHNRESNMDASQYQETKRQSK